MAKQPGGKKVVDRLRVLVLSDFLRAELNGKPIEWARYCADYRNRVKTLEQLNSDRYIQQLEDNVRWGLTFSGLASLATRDATALLADCRRVYNVLRKHYKEFLYQSMSVSEIADRIHPTRPVERVVMAVSLLARESGANLGVSGRPITTETKVNGNQVLLEASFTHRLKSMRARLARPRLEESMQSAAINPFPNLGFEGSQPDMFGSVVNDFGSAEVKEAWRKCVERVAKDLDGSITAARALVESACKQILDGRGIKYSPASKLPALYAEVRRVISLDPSGETDRTLQTIFQSCASIVNGLAELRNALGDSHGRSPGAGKPAKRHARLAVSLAVAMTEFLLATDEGRKLP